MVRHKKTAYFFLNRLVATLVAASFLCMPLLSGCTLVRVPVSSIEFASEQIQMRIGDTISVDSALVTILPQSATVQDYVIESSDPTVLQTDYRNEAKAVGVGEAVLTVTSLDVEQVRGSVRVVVDYAIPTQIELAAEGKTVQYLDGDTGLSAVTYAVVIPEFAHAMNAVSPTSSVSWYVQDELQNDTAMTLYDTFSFQPQAQGSYVVAAVVQFSPDEARQAASDLRVYQRFRIDPFTVSDTTALVQEEGAYRALTFRASYEELPQNPPPVIKWFLNGEPVLDLADPAEFVFLPHTAGKYEVKLTINDEPVEYQRGNSAVVVAKGSSMPQNVRFDFDDGFPVLQLSWDSGTASLDDVQYAVTVKTTSNRTIVSDYTVNKQNGIVSEGRIGVDLAEFIGADKAQNLFNTQFYLSVRSLGGDIFVPSDYTVPILTTQVPSAARPYLERTYYDGNRNFYAKTPEELCDIYTYVSQSRAVQFVTGDSFPVETFSVYVGYPFTTSVKATLEYAFSLRHATGYAPFSFQSVGQEVTVTVTYQTDGLPSVSSTNTTPERPNYASNIPHVSALPYDAARASRELPIASRPAVTVGNSQQLYVVAEEGFYPVVAGDSSAAQNAKAIYDEAESVLRHIISPQMTDLEKAHAIYDYVMWRTTYDYRAVGLDRDEAVRHTAYYLDGVFFAPRLAVCDGIAKAYSLLCNMEGIPSVRVAGRARTQSAWEGHAWNKVQIDGAWYIVDCTWGKRSMVIGSVSGNANVYDVSSHRYFLRTDSELNATHREDTPNNYPRTALVPFGFYEHGMQADFYMDALDSAAEAQALAAHMVASLPQMPTGVLYEYTIGQNTPDNRRQVAFVSFDVRIHRLYFSRYQWVDASPLTQALEAHGLRRNQDFYTYTDSSNGEMYQHIFISVHAPIFRH